MSRTMEDSDSLNKCENRNMCCFCFRISDFEKNQQKYMCKVSPQNIYLSCYRHINRDYLNEDFLNWNHIDPLPFCKKCLLCTHKLSRMDTKLQDIQNDIDNFVNSFTKEFFNARESAPEDIFYRTEVEVESNESDDTFDIDSTNSLIVAKKEIDQNSGEIFLDNGSDSYLEIKQENELDALDSTEYFTEAEHVIGSLTDNHDNSDLNKPDPLLPFEIQLKSETVEKDFKGRFKKSNTKSRDTKPPIKNQPKVKRTVPNSTQINLRRRKLNSKGSISPGDTLPRRKAALKAETIFISWNNDNYLANDSIDDIDEDIVLADNEELSRSNEPFSSEGDLNLTDVKDTLKNGTSKRKNLSLESKSLKKKFKCERCDKTYKNKYHLNDHERTHDDGERFQCKLCDTTYSYARTLRQHMVKHTENPKSNKIKPKNINSGKEKESKSKEKSQSGHLECKVCGKVCGSKGMLFYHSQSHKSGVLQVKCEVCNKILKNSLTFQKHKKLHLGNNTFTCDSCGKQFRSRSGLKEHEIRHNETEKAKLEDLFKCIMCSMTFYSAARLKRHSMIHTDERPYGPCEKCGNSFRTSSALKEHIRTHEGTERKSFECETCNKKFTTKSNLSQHMYRHNEDKTFQCTVCPKKFVTRDGLATHSKYHNSEKSFLCDECGKSFWTKTKLKIHYRIHTGDLIPCQYCDKKFDTTTHLKQHYRSHNKKIAEATVPDTQLLQNDNIEHLHIVPHTQGLQSEGNEHLPIIVSTQVLQNDINEDLPIVQSLSPCALCGQFCENQQCLHTQTIDAEEPPDSDHNFSSLLLINT